MKYIAEIPAYKGGGALHLIQCLRCKEVFTITTRSLPSSFDMRDVMMRFGEQHKKMCSAHNKMTLDDGVMRRYKSE